jgi:Uma2 family endonuclease
MRHRTMATAPIERWMTADELSELPDDGSFYELSRGMLVTMCPTSSGSGRAGGRIMVKVFAFIDTHNLGECGSGDMGFLLASNPDTVRAPDAWFVRADRFLEEPDPEKFFPGPPDLAIEVLSPSDRFRDVATKVRDYMDAGTPLLWVFDPISRLTAVFRPGQPVRFIDEDGVLDGEDVLPGFSLSLRDIFYPTS